MQSLETFACITADTGVVADILHVSPMFMSCGPRRRGLFADSRQHRARRTDARHARRGGVIEPALTAEVTTDANLDFRRTGTRV